MHRFFSGGMKSIGIFGERVAALLPKSQRSAGRLRSPRVLRHPPVDALNQVAELGWGDGHHAIGRRRPQETAALRPLGVERHAQPIVPQNLDQLTALATEHVKISAMWV